MLPEGCRINNLAADEQSHTITASVAGLTPDEIQGLQDDFEDESGMTLDLKGQMSLF
jgi:ATP-dependent helicase IRC3